MIRCRRGVGVVLSALFMILIFLLIIVTYMMVQTQQRYYEQAVEERSQRDVERLTENLDIIWALIISDKLNITIKNTGKVTAHLVDLWIRAYNGSIPNNPLWQRVDALSIYIEPGNTYSFNASDTFGTFYETLNYTVKIVTERGNIIGVQAPYPFNPPDVGGGGIGFYPIIIESCNSSTFQFKDSDHMQWSYAWIKNRSSPAAKHVVYRVLVNNTTDKVIELDATTVMLQTIGTQNDKARFIVSELTGDPDIYPYLTNPVIFESQSIQPKGLAYVYFAAETPSDEFSDWVADLTPQPETYVDPVTGELLYYRRFCPVTFMFNFRFAGETELRTLGLPQQVMQFKT